MISSCLVVGISGKKGVGKNYISERYILPMLLQKFKEKRSDGGEIILLPFFIGFGTCVKADVFSRHPGLVFEDLVSGKKTPCVRQLLQDHGTSKRRNDDDHGRPGAWIRQVEYFIKTQMTALSSSGLLCNPFLPVFMIQDIRFPDELEFVQNAFSYPLIVRVVADQRHREACLAEDGRGADPHISETALDDYEFPCFVYNDKDHTPSLQCDAIVDAYVREWR